MKKKRICCICKKTLPIGKYGNNAEPIMKGICCDYCNKVVVIPQRLKISEEK